MEEPAERMIDRVERRVVGRHLSAEVFALLEPDQREDPVLMESLIETLRDRCLPKAAAAPTVKCEPIGRLGATQFQFGQYAGKSFDEIPLGYLDWLCREQEEFYRTLRAYLKHPDLESRRRGIDP